MLNLQEGLDLRRLSFQVSGGLGNQLFCLSAGKFFERESQIEVGFYFDQIKGDRVTEVLDLEGLFGAISSGRPPSSFEKIKNRASKARFIKNFFNSSIYDSSVVGFDSNLKHQENKRVFRGYFQTSKYYASLFDREIDLEKLLINPSSWYTEMSDLFSQFEIGVIHVRRGDYQNHKTTLGLLGEEYYKQVVRRFVRSASAERWLVFSDDVAFCKEAFLDQMPHGTLVLEPPKESRPVESLVLMSLASHLAISNSTFSWWPAYLGKPKLVVAPKPWYSGLPEPEGLMPEGWTLLDSFFES